MQPQQQQQQQREGEQRQAKRVYPSDEEARRQGDELDGCTLEEALQGLGKNDVLELYPGVYSVKKYIVITHEGVIIRGRRGSADKWREGDNNGVVLRNRMKNDTTVSIQASGVRLENLIIEGPREINDQSTITRWGYKLNAVDP